MITHAASRKHYYTVLLDRTRGGVFLLAGKRMKGRKRVNIVPATTAAMVMICSVKVII